MGGGRTESTGLDLGISLGAGHDLSNCLRTADGPGVRLRAMRRTALSNSQGCCQDMYLRQRRSRLRGVGGGVRAALDSAKVRHCHTAADR